MIRNLAFIACFAVFSSCIYAQGKPVEEPNQESPAKSTLTPEQSFAVRALLLVGAVGNYFYAYFNGTPAEACLAAVTYLASGLDLSIPTVLALFTSSLLLYVRNHANAER